MKNFDIIKQIWHKMNHHKHESLTFEKIKSHLDVQPDMTDDMIFKIWGNTHADEAAKAATSIDIPGFTNMHNQITKFDEQQSETLKNFFLYITGDGSLFSNCFFETWRSK